MTDEPKKKAQPARPELPKMPKTNVPLVDPDAFRHIERALSGLNLPQVSALALGTSFNMPELLLPKLDFLSTFQTFEEERLELRKRVEEQTRALKDEKTSGKEKESKIAALESTLEELQSKEQISFLLNRVNQAAQRQLMASDDFRRCFLETRECFAFVMSVDIRRSTELMLKARTPEEFAVFITILCADLMKIIADNYGVFDKFTGDGVLAFFPDFYSGEDAAYYAVAAADRCHASFTEHYQKFRKSFSSVLTGVGLGIGLDYGPVHLVQLAGGLTVVGGPVVYACRLSGAPSGTTLVNQPAYEVISDKCGAKCFIEETNIEIKHEGGMLAYNVRLNGRDYVARIPPWLARAQDPSSDAEGSV